ncbi:MAG: hypothetical protein PHT54_04530 [Candidatus Nanoarchaeia archaeon]|nr:hypothetical protein [Candidatus Nanoarchaeia archaeon]
MKIDPYKHKEHFLEWKEKVKNGIPSLSAYNSDLVKRYVSDMEMGINVAGSSKKGSRSYPRLNTLRHRLIFLAKLFKERFDIDKITDISEEQLFNVFSDMRNGNFLGKRNKKYTSVRDYVKDFKAFWHWYQKINRKEGKHLIDITLDLDTSKEKPKWVYLSEEQIKILCNKAKYEYRVLIMFLFDSGIRAPTELVNIRVSDFSNDFKDLCIRDEISKTFGRKIKLMLCSDFVKEYVKVKKLSVDDAVFKLSPSVTNRYLKRLALKVFGSSKSLAGELYSNLTLYDFRHNSCCYWLPRYQQEAGLKYRFGWKNSDKIHYYSEMLGMKDNITEEDLFIDTSKTEIEQRLEKSEKERSLLQEKVGLMEKQMEKILEMTNQLLEKVG